jgi:cytochrome oxidase Cu insertion factor (SCO1/SenC/PrrC family)
VVWIAVAVAAILAVVLLWTVPRLHGQTGTLLVVVSGRSAGSLPQSTVQVRQADGTWVTIGQVSGPVPPAPTERQVAEAQISAGSYTAIRVREVTSPVSITVTAGRVEPVLIGFDQGRPITGAVYAGNDEANLGLGELSGKFVAMPAFDLFDQGGMPINLSTMSGKDVIIAAFHTTCHETCPLYTALFQQLAKRIPPTSMLLEVTTDPGADLPWVLAAYAKQVGASWSFGTGSQSQVANFWKPFGVELATGDTHTSTLALVDRHGYIRLVYRGVPQVGSDISPSLVSSLSAQGLRELGSGGDGWGAPDVLQALTTISGPERSVQLGGGTAPAFTLTSTDGSKVSLADLAGRPLVINFWASYCPPCKAEMPLLVSSVSQQSRARLVLIDEGDSRDSAQAFLDGLGIKQPALLDTDTRVLRSYGMFALPTTIFVRADGTIDRRQIGQLDAGVLAAELSNLANQ